MRVRHSVSPPGKDIPGEWWTLLHSEELDQLIRQALADSPTVAAAKARLREADENRRAQYGSLFPAADANISASRQKISGAGFGQPDSDISAFNLYNASVNVSYALDLFGGTRRKLEALQSQIDYQRFQLEGVYLTLTSNIVTTAVKDASLRAQIGAMRQIIEAQEKAAQCSGRAVPAWGCTAFRCARPAGAARTDAGRPAAAGKAACPDAPPACGACRQTALRGGAARIRFERFPTA